MIRLHLVMLAASTVEQKKETTETNEREKTTNYLCISKKKRCAIFYLNGIARAYTALCVLFFFLISHATERNRLGRDACVYAFCMFEDEVDEEEEAAAVLRRAYEKYQLFLILNKVKLFWIFHKDR